MNNKTLVLIVEDDESIRNFMSAIFEANGYGTVIATNGASSAAIAASHRPDLILLDLGLPDIDGVEVLKKLREWTGVPIVVVSARGHEREKVEALDSGADDYITKPFGTAELLARARAALRRGGGDSASFESGRVTVGELEIDYEKRSVKLAGREIHFTPIEYKIVALLARHAGKVLTHDFITKEVWGPYTDEIRSLRVNMSNIRRKVEKNPAEPRYVITEPSVGYKMSDE
ncbi:MAG: response regulator transcription factor [Synergistaceae bacterium]|jgi:two-component system KDP operon response regulator KdpE|nr:response regulator transcription factor [Synergistaceae bacterium]